MMVRHGRRFLALVTCALAVGVAPAAFAQRITGDIEGTVTDAQGSVTPGAAVTAECPTTGLSRNATSNQAGGYRLADLPICVYKVTVSLQGFKTTSRTVQVAVNTLTKADFALETGSISETVEVAGVAPIVEFSDELNNYVDADRINNLPINGRDFNALLTIVPGVQRSPGGGFLGVNITGQRTTDNNFMVDGISNNDRYYGGIAMGESGIVGLSATIVPAEAIAEFTVQQTPSAEFGVKGGAAINIVMKSGTNQLHGSAHYFHHEDWMDSKNFFTEKVGGDKTPLKNQQFGGTIGGPLVKDRTFFFGYYEAQRIKVATPYRAFVPTPGQVSEARSRIAAAGLRVNPAGEALLSFYPTDPSGEIAVAAPMDATSDSFSLKLDHRLNGSNQLAVRGMYGRSHQSAPAFSGTVVAADKPQDLFNSVTDPRVALVGLTWTSTLASNKIWETRIGYNYFSQTIGINNNIDPKSLGIDTGPLDPEDFGVPAVYYLSSFGYIGGVGGYPITTAPNANTDISSSFTWINGRHTFKLGGNFQHATTYSVRNRARTVFDFSGGTGDAVDSLVGILLGRADDAARSFGSTVRHLKQQTFGVFVNDEWKLSPRFTLSLGLRYDLMRPLSERDDIAANFFPDRGLVRLGEGIDQLYETDKNNFGPRAGFAWDLTGDGKTALRGGYALTYDTGNFAAVHAPYAIAGARTGAFTNPNLDVFSVRLDAGFGATIDDPNASCVDPNTLEGDWVCIRPGVPVFGTSPTGQPPFNAFAVDRNLKTPMYHLFHVSLQREVFKNNALTLSYVGGRGRNLLMVRDLNAPPVGTDFSDPQPHRPYATEFPDLRHIVQLVSDARSRYNSLQVSWRQANWKGINTQYNLTWSKCTDYNSVNRGGAGQAGQNQNPYDPAGGEGPCDHDRPLNFNVGGNYKIPAVSGLGRMGEGWQFSTIFSAMSGRPYTAHVNRDRSGQDFDRIRANCLGEVRYNPRDPDNYIANPEVFSDVAPGTLGSCGRNTIRGPGFAQWDLALVKNTRLKGRSELEFRVEVFNVLNRGNFGFLTTNVRSGAFGTVSSTPDVDQINPVVTSGGPRAGQFALKLRF